MHVQLLISVKQRVLAACRGKQTIPLPYGQMYTGEEQQCHRDMGRCWDCYRTPGQTHNQGLNRQK